MGRSLVSLGANIGDPLATIRTVADELRRQLGCTPGQFQISRMFRTPPVGGPSGQPPFVNAVAAINKDIDAFELWAIVRRLETEFGRERNLRWEARRIDLDILLCGTQRVWTPHFKVPHPRMCMRRFILVPAADVAPDWIDPVTGQTIKNLADSLQQGPGNLLLISRQPAAAVPLLEEAARQSVAQWIELTSSSSGSASTTASPSTRWVSLVSYSQLDAPKMSGITKLMVFLAAPPPSVDIAWEDYHRPLARELNLFPDAVVSSSFCGPRYLLAAENREWAVHELVAALEAMDCPVEPI